MASVRKAVTERSAQSSYQRWQGPGRTQASLHQHSQADKGSVIQGGGGTRAECSQLIHSASQAKDSNADTQTSISLLRPKERDADDPGKAFTEVTPVILGADAHSTLHSTGKSKTVMPVYTSAVALQGRKTPVMEKPHTTWARTLFKTLSKDTTVNCVVMKGHVPINLQLLQARYTC